MKMTRKHLRQPALPTSYRGVPAAARMDDCYRTSTGGQGIQQPSLFHQPGPVHAVDEVALNEYVEHNLWRDHQYRRCH